MAEPRFTAKQQRFIEEYVVDFCGTKAAIRAGYAEDYAQQQASQMLQKPNIKAEIEKLKEELAIKALISREMVIQGLVDEARYLGEGSSHSARVSSWAHLGKYLNMFTENVQIKGTMEVKSISNLIDELSNEGDSEEDELE